jgi:hypothetical protein
MPKESGNYAYSAHLKQTKINMIALGQFSYVPLGIDSEFD